MAASGQRQATPSTEITSAPQSAVGGDHHASVGVLSAQCHAGLPPDA